MQVTQRMGAMREVFAVEFMLQCSMTASILSAEEASFWLTRAFARFRRTNRMNSYDPSQQALLVIQGQMQLARALADMAARAWSWMRAKLIVAIEMIPPQH